LAVDVANPCLAGGNGRPIDVDDTDTTERLAAAELGAGHARNVPQIPEKRHLRIADKAVRFSVDDEFAHDSYSALLI
jgi:hypothetical protein